jgi:hypothetical protein
MQRSVPKTSLAASVNGTSRLAFRVLRRPRNLAFHILAVLVRPPVLELLYLLTVNRIYELTTKELFEPRDVDPMQVNGRAARFACVFRDALLAASLPMASRCDR